MVIFDTKGKLASGIPWHVADNRSCMWSALTCSLHVHVHRMCMGLHRHR